MKKRFRKLDRPMPKNFVRDTRTLDDIMDEMAIKWALRAEKSNTKLLLKK